MTTHIKVWATKETALIIKHPHGPKMTIDGAMWPQDSFTARRLRDGSVTSDAAKALKPEVEAKAVEAPAEPDSAA